MMASHGGFPSLAVAHGNSGKPELSQLTAGSVLVGSDKRLSRDHQHTAGECNQQTQLGAVTGKQHASADDKGNKADNQTCDGVQHFPLLSVGRGLLVYFVSDVCYS